MAITSPIKEKCVREEKKGVEGDAPVGSCTIDSSGLVTHFR